MMLCLLFRPHIKSATTKAIDEGDVLTMRFSVGPFFDPFPLPPALPRTAAQNEPYKCSDGTLTLVLEIEEKAFPFFFNRMFSYCARIVMPYEFKESFRLDEYT
jgi:hypothetical protein